MYKIQDLSRWIDFENLIYRYKGESASRKFVDFKGALVFFKNIKDIRSSNTRNSRRKTKRV